MERLFDFLRNYAFVRGVTYTSFGIALLMTLLAGHDIKHLGKDYPNDMSDLLLLMNRNNLDVPQSDMLLKSFKIVGVDSIVYDTINTTYSKPILIKTTVEEFCTLNTTSEKTISDVKWESILDEYGQKYRELEIMSKYITRNSLSQSQVNLLVDLLRVRGVDSLSFDKNRQNIETNKSEGGFKTISILAWKDTTFKNEIYSTIWESAKIESRRTPVAHLARLVSGFSACIFLLMFWFLYKKKIISEDEDEQNEPADFSMLFFGLAMLVWAFPTEQVFKIYDFRTFAKPLDDSRAFLNSVFFICGYWDLEYKFPNHWRKHFIAFSFPAWWKSFVEKYL
ncbi:MAG: hypothetical protein JNJ57_12720, partial [Saprospiraceae bacterium]|nr:hypothetical protein [Saprospiraceae bacterium]